MKKFFYGLAAVAILTGAASCGSASNEHDHSDHEAGGKSVNAAAAETMSPVDSLYEEVVALHDEAMPKMGKLKGFENLAKQKMDSLSTFKDAKSKALKAELEVLYASLQRAQKGMNDWMDTFQPEKYANQDSLKAYYEMEKVKAKAMRDDIFRVMDSAAARFGN